MGNVVANQALGRIRTFAELGAANDAIVFALIKASGLEADAAIRDHDTLAAVFAAANDECDATDYVRKSITSATVTVDDTNERVDIDVADQTWTGLGGATNNTIGALVAGYDGDTTSGSDTDIIPISFHTFSVTTDNSDVTAQVAAAGLLRAAG